VRDQSADADFGRLHEISRHATHSSETLTVTIQTIESMLKRHKDFYDGSRSQTAVTGTDWRATHQYIDFQAQLIRNLKLRSQANQERLQSEITLVTLPSAKCRPNQWENNRLTLDRLIT